MKEKWIILTTKHVDKQVTRLSQKVLLQLRFLFMDLANRGPAVLDWPNYGNYILKKVIKDIVICKKVNQHMFVVGKL